MIEDIKNLNYGLGIDFGTNSVRALILDLNVRRRNIISQFLILKVVKMEFY